MTRVRQGQSWELSRRQINVGLPQIEDALPAIPVSDGEAFGWNGRIVILRVAYLGNDPYTAYVYDDADGAWHPVKGAV